MQLLFQRQDGRIVTHLMCSKTTLMLAKAINRFTHEPVRVLLGVGKPVVALHEGLRNLNPSLVCHVGIIGHYDSGSKLEAVRDNKVICERRLT